jgi:tetratricopeptide (TPR) repeat protein
VRSKCAGRGTRAALVGLPGTGYVALYFVHDTALIRHRKSQLAIQYAHNVRDSEPHTFVFWVHASNRARFENAYATIADRIELPGRLDPKTDILRLVSDWLGDERNGPWTMVVDNVDDAEMFFPSQSQGQEDIPTLLGAYLPRSSNGSMLITSRKKDAAASLAGGYQNIREVPSMDESQGIQLLRNKLSPHKLQATSHEDDAMTNLLRALGYMPLAISQAAAYINRQARMTVAGYLREFQVSDRKRTSLLQHNAGDLRRDEGASDSVMTTLQMSFERIRQDRPSAADLLSLMSFFNPQGIPETILRRYNNTAAAPESYENANSDSSTFDEDLNTLYAYSLVTMTTDDETCEMHALVQVCTRVWLSSFSDVKWWKGRFVGIIAQEFPSGEFENWAICKQLLPHVETLYNHEFASDETTNNLAHVLKNAADYLLMIGSYRIAEEVARKSIAAREYVLGLNHQYRLPSVRILALVLEYQGKYDQAKELIQQVLERCEKELGVHHLDTLTIVSNLAVVLSHQGHYNEAEKLSRRAVEGYKKELGVHNLHTLVMVSNLAGVLHHQGHYNEAEQLNRQALEGIEKELGIHHPDTLLIINNLALVLQAQSKDNETEKLYRQALKGLKKELGLQHSHTLSIMNNLTALLLCQDKYNEAEELGKQVLQVREKEFGEQHPETLSSVSTLATVLGAQYKYEAAEKLYRRALEGREEVLRLQHPDTLRSVKNLAFVLQCQGKYEESEKFCWRALQGSEKELGMQHPDTLSNVDNLVSVLRDQGKYEEVEKLRRRAL